MFALPPSGGSTRALARGKVDAKTSTQIETRGFSVHPRPLLFATATPSIAFAPEGESEGDFMFGGSREDQLVTMLGWRWATLPSWRSEKAQPVEIRAIVSRETPV